MTLRNSAACSSAPDPTTTGNSACWLRASGVMTWPSSYTPPKRDPCCQTAKGWRSVIVTASVEG